MHPATGTMPPLPNIGRTSRSGACGVISHNSAPGRAMMRNGCSPTAASGSSRPSRTISRCRRRVRPSCSTMSMPRCRTIWRNSVPQPSRETAMRDLTLVEAINLALARALAEDEHVLVLGEDVGVDGGVFRATAGLLARFGPNRVMDTPLSETLISGLSVGLAAQGFRPVAEIQFMGFVYPCIDQMV